MKNEMNFPFQNFQVAFGEVEYNGRDWFVVRAIRKGARKPAMNYRFRTADERNKYYAQWKADMEKRAAEIAQRAATKKAVRENMVNPFKVGDIVYDSWGYDQTNINFYQIVETGPKSVVMREIAQNGRQEKGYSPMSSMVVARPDQFIGAPEKRNLQVLGDGTIYIKSSFGWIKRWDGKPKYASYYA